MPRDFAPGIPTRRQIHRLPTVSRPSKWPMALQAHKAQKAGGHFDLRLAQPGSQRAHSWALRHWPEVGETRLAVQQPTHRQSYMGFSGRIVGGYGAGTVALARQATAEVLHADDNHVRFNLYPGQRTEEYLLKRTSGSKWILKNLTKTRQTTKVPDYKPKYREKKPSELNPQDRREIWQPKLSGAHVLVDLRGQSPRVYSYRQGQRLIQHTPKIPGLLGTRVPKSLRGSILRAELVVPGLAEQRTGGILNSGVWKSRDKQKDEGRLRLYALDVVQWRGKDVESHTFGQKLPLIDEATRALQWLKKPRRATTPSAKVRMLETIEKRLDRDTDEGLVAWNLDKKTPIKAKFRPETDVYVRTVFMEKGQRGLAGGFEYSHTPGGPIAGRVGTGFDHRQKKDMALRPEAYKGLKAKILSQRGDEVYALQKPVFGGWHLDQVLPENLT